MSRFAPRSPQSSRVYAWLLARELAAAESRYVLNVASGGEWDGPSVHWADPALLVALEAGRPVSVAVADLPEWARPQDCRNAAGWSLNERYRASSRSLFRAVVVGPDGSVSASGSCVSRWAADNGL